MFVAYVIGLEQNSPHSSARNITLDGKGFYKTGAMSTGADAMLDLKRWSAFIASSDNSNFFSRSGHSFG